MLKSIKRAGLVAALAAASLFAVTPAQARDGYRDRGDDDAAAVAIVAGIAGLAIGAAIASDDDDHRHYRDRRYYRGARVYDRGYYRDGHYYRGDYPRYRYRDGYRSRDRHHDRRRDRRYYDRGW